MLVYDWTKTGDSEIVVEDVERLDFDQYGVYDTKMKDWRRFDKWDWNNSRQKYMLQQLNFSIILDLTLCRFFSFTLNQDFLLEYLNVPANQCPGILIPGEDYKVFENVLDNVSIALIVMFLPNGLRLVHYVYMYFWYLLQAPGTKYAKGYNTDMGDKGLLFKLS